MDDRQVIDAFVAHLRANGHPGLQVDRRPEDENRQSSDIDAIAGPFAIVHTSVDTLPNQRRNADWYLRVTDGLAEELATPPFFLCVTLTYDAVAKGQDWSKIRAALKSWLKSFVANSAPALPDGTHVFNDVPGVPFRLSMMKSTKYCPGISFARYKPEDDTLFNRLRALFDRKARKLAKYQPDTATILLVENGDIAHMDEYKMLGAIRSAYPTGRPAGVDQIWYAESSIPGPITFHDFTTKLEQER